VTGTREQKDVGEGYADRLFEGFRNIAKDAGGVREKFKKLLVRAVVQPERSAEGVVNFLASKVPSMCRAQESTRDGYCLRVQAVLIKRPARYNHLDS